MATHNGVVDRIGDRLVKKANSRPSVLATVNDFKRMRNCAKVICTVVGAKDIHDPMIPKAIEAALGKKAFVIAGSFREVAGMTDDMCVVGFVSANKESRLYDAKVVAKMQVIAKNVLMDETDSSVWDIKDVGGTRVMIRQQQENLSELLEMAKVRNVAIARVSQLFNGDAKLTEYCSYVDTADKCMKYGYAIGSDAAKTTVVCRATGKLEAVSNDAIVSIVSINDKAERAIHASLVKAGQKRPAAVTAAMSGDFNYSSAPYQNVSMSDMREYYKAVYGYSPEYWAEFEAMIDKYGF